MLSEFHLTAHSLRFISEMQDSDEATPETVDTSKASAYSIEDLPNNNNSSGSGENTDSFPPFLLLYVLWRPDMTTSVTNFTTEVILSAVEKMQSHHVNIALSDEDKKRSRDNLPKSSSRMSLSEAANDPQQQEHDSVTGSSFDSADLDKTQLYLVVERTIPYRNQTGHDTDNNENIETITKEEEAEKQRRQFEVEVGLAERLTRHIASHPQLRSIFQGITVGISNHKRAAPGLDACLDVVNMGSPDRRKIGRDIRSHVGLMALTSDDLLGLDEDGETDAAQDILQTRISTEWNGQGNLKSFAYRAHATWRKGIGLPPQPSDFPLTESKRRVPRRLRRLEQKFDSYPFDLLLNIGAFFMIAYYVWRGFINDTSEEL